jgi:hypothetical protein
MLLPVLIFFGASSPGVLAGARWLPDLAPGQVGGLAFFMVCGLVGAATGLIGVHIYSIVEELNHLSGGGGLTRGEVVAQGLRVVVYEAGSLLALAGVVYLLAPAGPEEDESEVVPSA